MNRTSSLGWLDDVLEGQSGWDFVRRKQRNDVRVGDIFLRHIQVFLDGDRQLGRDLVS